MQIKLNLLQKHIFNVQKIQKLKTKRFQRQAKFIKNKKHVDY